IRVRVTSNLDVKSTSSTSIHVKGSSITASFSYSPNNPKVGDPVTFRSNSKTRAGLITDWRWMINGQVMSRDKSFKHTFGEPGKARVQLRVKSSTNQKNDETKFLKIQKQPGAKLSANVRMNPKTAKPGETLKLWVIGNPITVSWDLDDDGIYEKVGNPIKTSFDNAGTQTIKVKISEDGTQTVQTVQINLQRLNLLEAIDQNGNGRIDSVEKTAAVTYWQDNDNVPGYEGKITDEQMIKIINYYRDGTEFVQD
ncbi:MAG: PKD domain-containing protein, partial [Halobacteria archaeon]